jgi:tRNA-dihydrouridine synthase B
MYDFYGDVMGVRIARKHIGWYCKQHANQLRDINVFRQRINNVESPLIQLEQVSELFTSTGKLLAA